MELGRFTRELLMLRRQHSDYALHRGPRQRQENAGSVR
jgi:hypothetical protein